MDATEQNTSIDEQIAFLAGDITETELIEVKRRLDEITEILLHAALRTVVRKALDAPELVEEEADEEDPDDYEENGPNIERVVDWLEFASELTRRRTFERLVVPSGVSLISLPIPCDYRVNGCSWTEIREKNVVGVVGGDFLDVRPWLRA